MEKVLVVDDDVDLLEMVTMMLQANDMHVKSLARAEHFLETVEQEKPDMIILDVFMGTEDGRDLCRKLKQSKHSSIPVLLYSAGNIAVSSITDSQADDFLPKPFDMNEFIKKVRFTLDKKKS